MPEVPTTPKSRITRPKHQWLVRIRPIEICSQSDFFGWQVETLVAKDFATYDHADPFRNRVAEFGDGLFQFTPPPPADLNFAEAMSRVELEGETGISHIRQEHHSDLVDVATVPSVLTDIDDGHPRLNVRPSVSRENIANEKRHAFCVWQGIVYVALFPWALRGGRGIDLVGSRQEETLCPSLHMRGGRPALLKAWEGCANPRQGAASYKDIILP